MVAKWGGGLKAEYKGLAVLDNEALSEPQTKECLWLAGHASTVTVAAMGTLVEGYITAMQGAPGTKLRDANQPW